MPVYMLANKGPNTTSDPAAALKAGSDRLRAAFAASPAMSSSNLVYDPASLSHKTGAATSSADSTFNGHASEKIAQKLQEYAKTHKGDGSLLQAYKQKLTELTSTKAAGGSTINAPSFAAAVGAGAATTGGTVLAATSQDAAFSLYHLMTHSYGFRVVYCILWIVLGLFLCFFGLQAFYWAIAPRFAPKRGKTSRRIMGGGIGGLVVGFLAGSYLGLIATNATATRHHAKLSAGGTFAIFLAPGLLFTLLSAHVLILSRLFLGLLSGVCLARLLTAMFGIHTILVRSILLAIFCVVLTLPLVVSSKSRYRRTKRWLLNIDTSIIGAVAFLDGVALFAPPEDASRAWIDLWTLFFAPDASPSQQAAIHSWGSSAFKGYIAGAVLLTVFSIAFEAWFHRNAGESVDDEWNEYLGVYTGNVERDAAMASAADRAGMYEPPKSFWEKVRDTFDDAGSSRRTRGPATYGNLAGGLTAPAPGGFTERPSSRQSGRRSSSRTSSRGPARFERLSKRDGARGDLEKLDEFDSDDDGSTVMGGDDDDDEKKGEAQDVVSALPKVNYGGYALPAANLPRPPSYRTESHSSSSSSSSTSSSQPRNSQLSGSTAVSSSSSSAPSTRAAGTGEAGDVLKPATVYRDSSAAARSNPASPNSKPAASSPLAAGGARSVSTPAAAPANMVAATPSLINAIDRIQRAQAQAKEWHAQHPGTTNATPAAPYGAVGKSDEAKPAADAPAAAAAASSSSKEAPATASAAAASSPPPGKTSFDGWWKREVEKK